MIERLNRVLRKLGHEPSLNDLRDILWLAQYLPAARRRVDAAEDLRGTSKVPRSSTTTETKTETPQRDPTANLRQVADSGQMPQTWGVYASSGKGSGFGARRIRVPGVPPLPQALDLGRALRPLGRRRPAGASRVLDEQATAERIAETGLRIPVFRQRMERWFDVVLAVEEVPSLVAWQPVVAQLEELLQRHGGFRGLTRISLKERDGRVTTHLKPGNEIPVASLYERRGRRLVLVASDCTSLAWHQGAMGDFLAQMGTHSPVAIVQLLPEVLWPNTAVGFAELKTSSAEPGASTAHLRTRRPTWANGEPGIVVPVVSLEPSAVKSWARMVMAAGNAWSTAALLPLGRLGVASDLTEPAKGTLTAEQRVSQFRAASLPEAQRLAAYFSIVRPLTLPVMRLIQDVMLPKTGAAALAQVILGGVLRPSVGGALSSGEKVEYDFLPGVRAVLMTGLLRSEWFRVNLALQDFIEHETRKAFSFFAYLTDASGADEIPTGDLPFVRFAREVADRFRAADVTQRIEPLEQRAPEAQIFVDDGETEMMNAQSPKTSGPRDHTALGYTYDTEVVTPPIVDLTVGAPPTQASIGQPGEFHWYRFVVPAAGGFTIETRGRTDIVMSLFGPNNQTALLTEDDDSGQGVNARIASKLSAGTYFVRIRHYQTAGIGSYGISVRGAAPPLPIPEIPVNGPAVQGNIVAANEKELIAMRVLYLQKSDSRNGRDALRGRRLLGSFKAASDDCVLAHLVMAHEDLARHGDEKIRAMLGSDLVSEKDLEFLNPNLIYLEGGLLRGGESWKLPEALATRLLKNGAVIIVADVDQNAWMHQKDVYLSATGFLGAAPQFRGSDEPVYAVDSGTASEIRCRREQMVISDWLAPVYDGVPAVLVGAPVKLTPHGSADVLASTNRDTSGTMQYDVWVDEKDAAAFATVAKREAGFVVLIAAGVSADVWSERNEGNLRWMINVARHLLAEVERERLLAADAVRSPFRVFLSHRSTDKAFVEAVGLEMKRRGVGVWLDKDKLVVSDSLTKEIGRALDQMTHFALFWSVRCLDSAWIEKELQIGLALIIERQIPILLIRLDDAEVPTLLKDLKRIDAEGMSTNDVAAALADAIHRLARRQRTP